MTQFTHYGLFFTEAHLQRAQKHKDKTPFTDAWTQFNAPQTDPYADMLIHAYRYRLGDNSAGEIARGGLSEWFNEKPSGNFLTDMRHALLTGQVIELIRPLLASTSFIRQWGDDTAELLKHDTQNIHEQVWKGVLTMAFGIIMEDETSIDSAVTTYKHAIDDLLHPEGYMPTIVDHQDEVTGFTYQIQATQALVLMAELAKHIGVDLYSYNKRGVSVTTATAYPLYYYFYPEKWRWSGDKYRPSAGVPEEIAKQVFRDHAGFLEIIAEHYTPPLKAIKMILDDLRPIQDIFGGGFVTLTHAPAPRKGLFG
jgi:hypothetical protein